LDALFLRFKGLVEEMVAPIFGFEMKNGSWYRKDDLIELTLHTALMNSYAEGIAEILREHRKMPTSETLLDRVKTITVDEVLEVTEDQMGRCAQRLKEKGTPHEMRKNA